MDPSVSKFVKRFYGCDGVPPPQELIDTLTGLGPKASKKVKEITRALKETESEIYEGCSDLERRIILRDRVQGLLKHPDLLATYNAHSLKELPLDPRYDPASGQEEEQEEVPEGEEERKRQEELKREREAIVRRARLADLRARRDVLANEPWGPKQWIVAKWLRKECTTAIHRLSMLTGEMRPTDPVESLDEIEGLFHEDGTPNVNAIRPVIEREVGVDVSNKTIALFFERLYSSLERSYGPLRSAIVARMRRELEKLDNRRNPIPPNKKAS